MVVSCCLGLNHGYDAWILEGSVCKAFKKSSFQFSTTAGLFLYHIDVRNVVLSLCFDEWNKLVVMRYIRYFQ